jgi:GR25 family glycosyltransferase involved in LPS biosynthesis
MDNIEHFYSIWLPRLITRKIHIDNLESKLKKDIHIFQAYDGNKYIKEYENHKHILAGQTITAGMIGCLKSHLDIIRNNNYDKFVIFEDDCEFVSSIEELNIFLLNIPSDYDIICLGTNENVDFIPTKDISKVHIKRFWGTHALILTKKACISILETYESYNNDKIFLPADWLYSIAIIKHKLKAYAPYKPSQYFKQISGLISSINGKIRS